MARNEILEKKNEILRRNISELVLRKNQSGLNEQENQLMKRFIKEFHHNNYSLRTSNPQG